MKNTDEIFHDLLVFQSMAYMDLEHGEPGECLRISRRCFFHVKFKNKSGGYDQIVDVYDLICKFSGKLLDAVCLSCAEEVGIQFSTPFHYEMKEFNCINTLLEIDLYPSLFDEWWEGEVSPMNYGVRVLKHKGDAISAYDKVHKESYSKLCASPDAYKQTLLKYRDMSYKDYFNDSNVNDFYSFIYFNHWHYKKSFGGGLDTAIQPSEIMDLQRLGKGFLTECQKEKFCTIMSTSEDLKAHFEAFSNKI